MPDPSVVCHPINTRSIMPNFPLSHGFILGDAYLWYYTGNFTADNGDHYGYQLTFFRRALLPTKDRITRESEWAVTQIYFAHFALTDVDGNSFNYSERFARNGVGLAGSESSPYRVWLENWSVEEIQPGQYQLSAQDKNISLNVILTDQKGPVPQGVEGYSQKGLGTENASYYYSQTRLKTTGSIQIGERSIRVTGLSWKDHEYSTSALSDGQIGWDWFSIQLDNDMEIMLFYLRRENGSIDPFSSGTIIYPDGSTQALSIDDFSISIHDTWISPNTGAEYPSSWHVSIPQILTELEIQPYMQDQELLLSFVYWEGAVKINGNVEGQIVSGNGFIEMTGYFLSMEGEF